MPPLRKYSTSTGVSMRQSVSKGTFVPSVRVATTSTFWRGSMRSSMTTSKVSVPSSPIDSAL